jgi:hypothetical protein
VWGVVSADFCQQRPARGGTDQARQGSGSPGGLGGRQAGVLTTAVPSKREKSIASCRVDQAGVSSYGRVLDCFVVPCGATYLLSQFVAYKDRPSKQNEMSSCRSKGGSQSGRLRFNTGRPHLQPQPFQYPACLRIPLFIWRPLKELKGAQGDVGQIGPSRAFVEESGAHPQPRMGGGAHQTTYSNKEKFAFNSIQALPSPRLATVLWRETRSEALKSLAYVIV